MEKKSNQVLSTNMKALFGGGQKIIPLFRDGKGNQGIHTENNLYWNNSNAYEISLEDLYRIDLAISYLWDKPKTTHELFLDFYNVTGTQGKLTEYYDPAEPASVGCNMQEPWFPNVMYRLYFYFEIW